MKSNSGLSKHFVSLGVVLLTFASLFLGAQTERSDIGKRLDASAAVLDDTMATPDKAIPSQVLAQAQCIVIIPSLVRIALGIGARHGKGVATCRVTNGWSAPSPVVFSGGGVGFQIGGESVDLIMIAMDQNAIERLMSSKFKIGTNIPGRPGPVGSNAARDTKWSSSEILSYSKSRGAFAGVDLNGASLKQDKDATVELYGKYVPFGSILMGKLRPPPGSANFLAAVRKYAHESQTNQGKSAFRAGFGSHRSQHLS